MANFTKKAIKETFIELLASRPLAEISVRTISTECGINRNTFYYHYSDIPSLIEEIVTEEFDSIIESHPNIDSMEDGLFAVAELAKKNRKALMHIYNSVSRNIFEDFLWKLADSIIESFTSTILIGRKISKNDKRLLNTMLRAIAVGVALDWMNSGLQEDVDKDIRRICEVTNGSIERIIKKCENA